MYACYKINMLKPTPVKRNWKIVSNLTSGHSNILRSMTSVLVIMYGKS